MLTGDGSDVADKFIEWLPCKHKPQFLFHCAVFAMKSKLWEHCVDGRSFDEFIKRVRKIFAVCYWPIADEARFTIDEEYLKGKRLFQCLCSSDFSISVKHE